MPLEKAPFRTYTLEENKKNPLEAGRIFTIRLNPEEYAQLKENMKLLNIKNESTTLKLLAEVGHNVIHTHFSSQKIRWLFNPNRRKLED